MVFWEEEEGKGREVWGWWIGWMCDELIHKNGSEEKYIEGDIKDWRVEMN